MLSSIFRMFYGVLLGGVTLFLVGCTAQIDTPDPKIVFSADRHTIETEDQVTVNAVLENASSIVAVQWTTDSQYGVVTGSVTTHTVFVSSRNVGQTAVTVRFITEDASYSSQFPITIEYPDTVAPASVKGVVYEPGDNQIAISWNPNTESDLGGYMIKYSTTPNVFDHFVDVGNVNQYVLTGLTNSETYYIILTAYDNSRQKNESVPTVQSSAIPTDLGPTGPVRSLFARSVSGGIQLTWFNPTDADFNRVILRRSNHSAPTNPTSGDFVYEGPAESFLDTEGLVLNQTYYYSIFAMDDEGEGNSSVVTSYQLFYR